MEPIQLIKYRPMSLASSKRGRLLELDLIDPWVPNAQPLSLWERTKKFLKATLSISMVKYAIKGWKPRQFALEAQDMYIRMNELLAKNDMEGLKQICTSGMIQKLKNEAKQISLLGQLEWKSHGQENPPKLLHAAQAKAQMQEGEQKIVQATVQLNLKQSVAITKGGQVKSGGLDKIEAPTEYIILEKWLDKPNSPWLIKAKL